MGKESAPATPNYQPIATASVDAAKIQAQEEQNALAQEQSEFQSEEQVAQPVIAADTAAQQQQTQIAQQQENTYLNTYLPIEQQFANTATNYDSADQANQQAGAAEANVATQFDASRASALSSLESYGIDPSQTRYAALDLGSNVQQAAATAAAGTQSRLNTQQEGLSLESAAINTGRGYAQSVSNSYAGATGAGTSAVNASNSTGLAGVQETGSPTQWGALENSSNQTGISALSTQYGEALEGAGFNNSVIGGIAGNLAGLAGGALGAFGGSY
jgi:hypothetical protein